MKFTTRMYWVILVLGLLSWTASAQISGQPARRLVRMSDAQAGSCTTAKKGTVYYSTTSDGAFYCDGSTWTAMGVIGGGSGDALTTNPLSQFAATTSAQLAGVLSDETGSGGGFVRATAPTIDSPIITTKARLPRVTALPGTPSAGDTVIVTDDSATGACDSSAGSATTLCQYNGSAWVALGDGGSGGGLASTDIDTSAELAAILGDETGNGGGFVRANNATLVAPALGTPASGTLTNATGLPVSTGISGLGTGVATALATNVGSAGAPVVLNGAGGTPSSITLTNGTGLPVSGITASTSTALGVGSVNLGHASDTTIARVSAGVVSIEGVNIVTESATQTLTNKTLTSPVIGTKVNLPRVTALPGTPSAGDTVIVTDDSAAGACDSAAGSATTLCQYNGSAWVKLGDGTGAGGSLASSDIDTSAEIAAIVGDETGSDALVFQTSPTLTTPRITTAINDTNGNEIIKTPATSSAVNELTVTNSATGNPVSVAATGDDTNISLNLTPKGTGTVNVTGSTTGVVGLIDTDQSHYLNITPGSNLTADRTFTITTGDAARTLSMSGNITTAADFITSGANSLTLTTTGSTNVTLPTTGTLATTAGNVATATALAANPSDCSANNFATTIAANGNLTCAQPSISAGVSGLGTGVATFLGTPSSANLASALTDETGTGAAVFGTAPTLTGPIIQSYTVGTLPAAVTNKVAVVTDGAAAGDCETGSGSTIVLCRYNGSAWKPLGDGASGSGLASTDIDTSSEIAAIVGDETGSGALVFATSPAFTTPNLGTPSAVTLTNGTGLPVSGITASTSTAIGVGSVELGHASDTTIARSGAGAITVEGVAVPTISSTSTFTNKTYDTSATGNVFTSTHKTYVPAAGCSNATAYSFLNLFTSLQPTPTCVTGTNRQKGVLNFPDSDGEYQAQFETLLPSDWAGSVDVRIRWYTSATSGDVVWQVACSCVADAETDDPSFNAASTVTDTAKGTTLQMNDATITGLTTTGCSAGEMMNIKVFRQRTHASDTLTGTINLVGVEITATRVQ